jgi:hypothetical protein
MLACPLLSSEESVAPSLSTRGIPMWYGIAQAGLATTGVNFTDSLSLLIAGPEKPKGHGGAARGHRER